MVSNIIIILFFWGRIHYLKRFNLRKIYHTITKIIIADRKRNIITQNLYKHLHRNISMQSFTFLIPMVHYLP
jgi:hypothetical protein